MTSANALKEQGNKYYQAKLFDEAIGSYTKAIVKDPDVAAFYTNRALCYLQKKQAQKAIEDCKKAKDLEPKSVKAYYFLGRALISTLHYDEALKSLIRANELATSQKLCFGDDITALIRTCKREIFKKEEEKRIEQEIGLQEYVNKLIDDDCQKRIEILNTQHDCVMETVGKASTSEEQEAIKNECFKYKNDLQSLLCQVDERRRKRDLPDYLCGRISYELMTDPVITPSGITYDRNEIVEHLQRVGHFDPVSRVPLTAEQLVPNYAMKEVIDHFVKENPWASYV